MLILMGAGLPCWGMSIGGTMVAVGASVIVGRRVGWLLAVEAGAGVDDARDGCGLGVAGVSGCGLQLASKMPAMMMKIFLRINLEFIANHAQEGFAPFFFCFVFYAFGRESVNYAQNAPALFALCN